MTRADRCPMPPARRRRLTLTALLAVALLALGLVISPPAEAATLPPQRAINVASSSSSACGLTTAGAAICWGLAAFGATNPPAGETFTALNGGGNVGCGLRANGSIRCWGDSGAVSILAPPADTFASFDTDGFTACGVTTGGELRCWGSNGWNQLLNIPTGSDFAEVTVGATVCARRTSGVTTCWGRNDFGQRSVPAATSFSSLSTSALTVCGVTTGGGVRCWGADTNGLVTTAPAGTDHVTVTVGSGFACALRIGGQVSCWGSNPYGATVPPPGELFSEISAGGDFLCGLTSSGGRIVCWGLGAQGQTTVPTGNQFGPQTDSTGPVIIATVTGPVGSADWYVGPVTVSWSVTDPDSPVISSSGCDTVVLPADTAGTPLTCSAVSAGGSNSASTSVKIDQTPPTLTPTASPGSVPVGGTIVIAANASDSGSGLASATCGTVDTSAVGTFTATCDALDVAGNSATASATYTVTAAPQQLVFGGFQQPVDNRPAVNAGRKGSVYPIKFQLSDGAGGYVSDLAAVTSITYRSASCATFVGEQDELEATSPGATQLRYDTATNTYIFNWASPRTAGCYVLTVALRDGTTYAADFKLR